MVEWNPFPISSFSSNIRLLQSNESIEKRNDFLSDDKFSSNCAEREFDHEKEKRTGKRIMMYNSDILFKFSLICHRNEKREKR